MTQPSNDESTAAGEEDLRDHVEATRQELGKTVEALAAKADVKSRAQEKAAEVKGQAAAKAGELKVKAAQGARAARDHRALLLTAAGVVVLVWLARRRSKG
ncbi:DUF3618 domain-containing protein [Streptomyces sp. NPDC056600]|uniref:DUF3618 domain-containing protein n=1 Tax=Streptomyces sp. NPDC056600 TaxID=3345874 RepID=UPI0036817F11